MTQHPQRTSQPALNPSWMLTFGDLLGIILATFVLIYAASDRQTPALRDMIAELSAGLFVEASQDPRAVVTDIMSPVGYQKALLQKQLDTMPYWSLNERANGDIALALSGQRLSGALYDGVWLDVIERFNRPVSLVMTMPEKADVAPYLSGVTALNNARKARGLSAQWRIAVARAPSGTQAQTQIIIHHPDRDAPLQFFTKDETAAPTQSAPLAAQGDGA